MTEHTTLWAPPVKYRVSMKKKISYENRGQKVKKNGGRVQRELAVIVRTYNFKTSTKLRAL